MTKNQTAFLYMIAYSELGPVLLEESDNGYNVLVGSTPRRVVLFDGYDDHPRRRVDLGNGLISTAAGRYQVLMRIFDHYKRQLKLPDFSPDSQDRIALQLIKECDALEDIEEGRITEAITKCRSRWASLPDAGYGQHENKMGDLLTAYVRAGGGVTK